VKSVENLTLYSFKDQLHIVSQIETREGTKTTIDCPFCGGKKKFTIDKYDGKLLWNCFRASCNVRGSYQGRRSVEATKAYLSGHANEKQKTKHVPIPQITTKPENHEPTCDYLRVVNSWEAYLAGDIKVRYAPKENRVLFYNKEGTGAVGRFLGSSKYKWWNYGDLSGGIHVGDGDHAILVEDAPSACAVSQLTGYVGVAILGTTLTKPLLASLSKYTETTLVLDKDASSKAVLLTRRHSQIDKLRLTEKDLKWMNGDQLAAVLR
jgi:hypothetical protein